MFVPGTVAGYVPWRLRGSAAVAGGGVQAWAAAALIAAGVVIYFLTAFWGFAAIGRGTPAPIDAPKILVVRGLHRFVRNPMYVGVVLVVLGQAWLFWSSRILIYGILLWLGFHLFVLVYEEPTLKRLFGEEYDRYRAEVPRWIPKVGR